MSEVIPGELNFPVVLEYVEMYIFPKIPDPPHFAFPS